MKTTSQPHKKGAGGRRTKLTRELTRNAAELKRAGNSNAEVAAALGISEFSLYNYQNINPEFSEALKGGRSFAVAIAEGKLFKRACGYDLVKQRRKYGRHEKGKQKGRRYLIEETEEGHHVPPDPTSLALFLNNNAPDRYRRNQEDLVSRPAMVVFQFIRVTPDGKEEKIEWVPGQPPPRSVPAS